MHEKSSLWRSSNALLNFTVLFIISGQRPQLNKNIDVKRVHTHNHTYTYMVIYRTSHVRLKHVYIEMGSFCLEITTTDSFLHHWVSSEYEKFSEYRKFSIFDPPHQSPSTISLLLLLLFPLEST